MPSWSLNPSSLLGPDVVELILDGQVLLFSRDLRSVDGILSCPPSL
jgi:hypothetical protein